MSVMVDYHYLMHFRSYEELALMSTAATDMDMLSVDQIAQKEAEVDSVVLQARRESEGRVKAASGRCEAEDELEEALLELTVRKNEPHVSTKFIQR